MSVPGVAFHAGGDEKIRPLVDRAVEALRGTVPGTRRWPVSPVRWVLPPRVGRAVSAFDGAVDGAFAALRGHAGADRVFYSASTAADFSVLWHGVGLARALRSPPRRQEAVRLSVALILDSVVINAGIKSLFRRTRPLREEHQHLRLRRPRSSSFPSGHATSAFLAATLLADGDRGPAWWAAGWYGLAAVVATSRIHVGIHHASDVLTGAVVGTCFGLVTLRLWPLPDPAPATPGMAPAAAGTGGA